MFVPDVPTKSVRLHIVCSLNREKKRNDSCIESNGPRSGIGGFTQFQMISKADINRDIHAARAQRTINNTNWSESFVRDLLNSSLSGRPDPLFSPFIIWSYSIVDLYRSSIACVVLFYLFPVPNYNDALLFPRCIGVFRLIEYSRGHYSYFY